jgi:N-acylglucosamine 2-epimerase
MSIHTIERNPMRRRGFIAGMSVPAIALAAAGNARAVSENGKNERIAASAVKPAAVTSIGGKTLQELRDFHRKELFDEYIALWLKSGIDWEYGGSFPEANPTGDPSKSTDKEMYYQGRALWVFSYIYNHFGKDDRFLKAARLTRDFVVKNCREGKYWISTFTREGKKLQGSFNIYGDIYMVLGLAEYSRAVNSKEDMDMAVESAYGVMERVVSPEYQHLSGHGGCHEPGTKRLGTWQHFLSSLTPLLRYTTDDGVDMIARMNVRNILERHYRPELGVAFEHLDDLFQPFRNDPRDGHRVVSGWHSIQAAWMCMDEALRRGQTRMFMDALEMGRMTMEKCWVDGKKFSGLISLSNPEEKPQEPATIDGIATGALDDALVFCLMAIEHTQEAWALEWYDRVFTTGYRNPERWRRRCLLHHPRRLFLSIQILDNMIARGGKASGFLDKA